MAGKFQKGKRCSSSCQTRDHRTWAECVRAKGLQVSPAVNDSYGTRQKAWDKELDSYESAVRQGVQPRGTKQHLIDEAMKQSDASGVAYTA
jgi:hypothetical protein